MSRALKILHLSDLHIPKEFINDRDFKTVKVNLLKDIEQQKKKYGKMDVAVFTGDFVDKGNVELFKEDMYTFISEVLDTAGIPKENVVFVPGNHDAKRPEGMVYEEIQKVRENCEVTNNKDDVGYMCKRFQPFVDFCMQFSESTIECDKSYGITDISLDDNEVYRFIRINSALATYDKNDYNNLFVTKVQLDDILRQMDDRIKPRITFLVMHHPMDWFTYEERVLLEEYIADETKFNVDIILNGHIHNGQVSLKSDLLVPEGRNIPSDLEEDIVILHQPLDRIYLAATSVMALFDSLDALDAIRPDIVILDVMLPDIDGYEVCKRIRQFSHCPILFLSSKNDEVDKILGLAVGGDDYVTKPFSPKEVAFRVKAQLRRAEYRQSPERPHAIIIGELVIDPDGCRVAKNGKDMELTAREFEILHYLAQNIGRVISRERLYEAVWGEDGFGCDNTIMVHIRHLREKLEDNPTKPQYIITMKGLGYKLVNPYE